MTTQLKENEFLLRCSCGTFDHMAMLIHEPDDPRGDNFEGQNDDWYLLVLLKPGNFLKRLGLGIKYIFAPQTLRYGIYTELVLRTDDVADLAEFIHERRNGKKR